ncbi:MAG: MFS transporter [Rubrobacter sp.]|nr:MFS transporter [Rubrobacter sp.]
MRDRLPLRDGLRGHARLRSRRSAPAFLRRGPRERGAPGRHFRLPLRRGAVLRRPLPRRPLRPRRPPPGARGLPARGLTRLRVARPRRDPHLRRRGRRARGRGGRHPGHGPGFHRGQHPAGGPGQGPWPYRSGLRARADGGPLLGSFLSLHSLQAPALAASGLALANAAFGLFVLPESLPEGRRFRAPLLRLDPFSGLVRTLRMGGTGPLLLAVLFLNLAFAGLLTNFPLFSGARFGWGASENAFLFAFVGGCAVLTQGLLVGRMQKRFGEPVLALGGLITTALCLALVGASTSGWMLYPVLGALAVGAGLAIPALTTLLSRRAPDEEQGRLMGGVQAVLSLALISGPLMAGAAFDEIGVPAPYFVGAILAALALPAVALSLQGEHIAQEPAGAPKKT